VGRKRMRSEREKEEFSNLGDRIEEVDSFIKDDGDKKGWVNLDVYEDDNFLQPLPTLTYPDVNRRTTNHHKKKKNKKKVDRRASKGRKIRYDHVHDKLEHFMFPTLSRSLPTTTRRGEEEEAGRIGMEELVSGLFGRRPDLESESDDSSSDGGEDSSSDDEESNQEDE